MKMATCGNASEMLFVLLLASVPARGLAAGPRDAINLTQAHVYNSPQDIASWPVTTAITQLQMRPSADPQAGLSFAFSPALRDAWKLILNPTTGDNYQYTVWAVVMIDGQWYTSGFIQMWKGRPSTGAPILSDFARNWAYDARWGPMMGHQPHVGEQMGFFVSAGNARGTGLVTSVRERSNVVLVTLPAQDTGVFTFPQSSRPPTAGDFDGDGRADLAVYRPSNGTGYVLLSGSGSAGVYPGGRRSDIPVLGDFDGDGKSDPSAYRPSNGTWGTLESSTGILFTTIWGLPGDIPVPGDYDGDGKSDIAVYRPSNGVWYILQSSTSFTGFVSYVWGLPADIPVPADYDGDGKTDIAVYRPSNGGWAVLQSSTNYATYVVYLWGLAGDIPVPGDYDGDGRTDIAVYRPSNGGWAVLQSSTNYATYVVHLWGLDGDIPVPGDYDGDGKTDIAVYRPSNGSWAVLQSSTNDATYVVHLWGVTGDIPVLQRH